MQLTLPPQEIAKFKRKALRSKDEILAALVGTITKTNDVITSIEVDEIVYLPQLWQGPEECGWEDFDVAKLMIAVWPRRVVGSIHSHPECEIVALSPADVEVARMNGEIISGVFTWWTPKGSKRRQSRLDWYSGVRPITLE